MPRSKVSTEDKVVKDRKANAKGKSSKLGSKEEVAKTTGDAKKHRKRNRLSSMISTMRKNNKSRGIGNKCSRKPFMNMVESLVEEKKSDVKISRKARAIIQTNVEKFAHDIFVAAHRMKGSRTGLNGNDIANAFSFLKSGCCIPDISADAKKIINLQHWKSDEQ